VGKSGFLAFERGLNAGGRRDAETLAASMIANSCLKINSK
jgi:hypothetical protein